MSTKKYQIREVPKKEVIELVQKNHYSPVMPKLTKHWLGVFKGEEMVGAITLGWGTKPKHTIQKIVNKDLTSGDYYEIGKMCMLDSEPRNSETQMISQLVGWLKERNQRVRKNNSKVRHQNMQAKKRNEEEMPLESEVSFLYTLADGIMGKCGYVYQAANFHYGGEYWTDSYMSAKGEKVHPRTTRELCKENWKWHYDSNSIGFKQEFKDNFNQKLFSSGGSLRIPERHKLPTEKIKAPKRQVFWLTPEFMNHKGMKKIKGKMFRYIYPLSKKAEKMLKKAEQTTWKIGKGVYPKEKDLKWRQMVARGTYEFLDGIPKWDLTVVDYNKKNVNQVVIYKKENHSSQAKIKKSA
tara:strand:+ start:26243 stop:27298 length:1056 start_codon:yes stop_codon:yes gene_type:complete